MTEPVRREDWLGKHRQRQSWENETEGTYGKALLLGEPVRRTTDQRRSDSAHGP